MNQNPNGSANFPGQQNLNTNSSVSLAGAQNTSGPTSSAGQQNLNSTGVRPNPTQPAYSANSGFIPGNAAPQQHVNNAGQFIKEGNKPAPVKKKKGFLSKELVTIIGVLAIVAILYFTYNYQLNKNLEIISSVPVAKEKIKAGTRITEENISYIDVPASTLRTVNAITNAQEIIGKYVNYDTIIPANSLFYSEALSATDTAPNSIFKNLIEQDAAIMINVDLESTYGNSIMPGDIVDIYVDAQITNAKGKTEYVTGPLVTGAKVLAVLDGSGDNVFANHENKLYPSYFVFTLESDIINLIRKAQKLGTSEYAMTIYPVVDGKTYKGNEATRVNDSQIVDLIKNATVEISNND